LKLKKIKKRPHRTPPEILVARADKKKLVQKPLFEEKEGFSD